MGGVILSLLFSTPVQAAVSNRVVNIKSHGVFVGRNGSKEVVLDSADLRYLANQLDVLDRTIQGLTLQSNANIEYNYHEHKKGDGALSSSTVYSATDPGGCYRGSGHTHNKTGTCSTKQVPVGQCQWVTTGFKNQGYCSVTQTPANHRYVKCTVCGRRVDGGCTNCGSGMPDASQSVCSGTITQYTCGSPTNTWVIGCGKTTSSIDSAYIVFD